MNDECWCQFKWADRYHHLRGLGRLVLLLLLLQNRQSNTSHRQRERERKGLLMNEWMDGGWIGKTLWNGECEMGEWKYKSLAYTHFHLSSQKLWISNHCHSSFELQCKSKRGVGIGKDALTFVGVGRHLHGNTAPTLSPFIHPFDPSIPLSMRMMMTMIKKYICTSVSIETEVDEDTA